MTSLIGQPIETWVQYFVTTGKLASLSNGTNFGVGWRPEYAALKKYRRLELSRLIPEVV
jgi:hypothetical protein